MLWDLAGFKKDEIVRASVLSENESTLDTPIDKAILTDPTNPLVQLILYIYSMETFIFPGIMRASRQGDKSKVNNLGPYTLVLSEIIQHTAEERKDIILFNQ